MENKQKLAEIANGLSVGITAINELLEMKLIKDCEFISGAETTIDYLIEIIGVVEEKGEQNDI